MEPVTLIATLGATGTTFLAAGLYRQRVLFRRRQDLIQLAKPVLSKNVYPSAKLIQLDNLGIEGVSMRTNMFTVIKDETLRLDNVKSLGFRCRVTKMDSTAMRNYIKSMGIQRNVPTTCKDLNVYELKESDGQIYEYNDGSEHIATDDLDNLASYVVDKNSNQDDSIADACMGLSLCSYVVVSFTGGLGLALGVL